MPELKILIAEDEPDVREIMAKWVRNEGYEVITASDGAEAWEKIQKESPDMVLLDLVMPGLNGLEVLKLLRAKPTSKTWQPVIIVSAHGQLEDIKKGFSLEADHYLTKPCTPEDILKGIRVMATLIPLRRSGTHENT